MMCKIQHPVINSLIIVTVIVCVTISGVLLYSHVLSDLLEEEVADSLAEVSKQQIEVLKARMTGNMETLHSVATFVGDMESSDITSIVKVLDRENRQNAFSRMGFILPDGQAFSCDGYELNFSNRDFFHIAMQGRSVITGVQIDNIDGSYVIIFAYPVYSDNNITGIVYATNNTQVYREMLNNSSFNGAGFSHIIRSDGTAVLKADHPFDSFDFENIFDSLNDAVFFRGNSLEKIRSDIAGGKSGIVHYELYDVPRYVNYAPTDINDWFILSVVPASVISEKSAQIINCTLLLCAAICVIFTGLLIYILILQQKSRKALYCLAYQDPLTGMNNANKFISESNKLLKNRSSDQYVLFYFDIDKFKMVNNTFGFDTGNYLLKNITVILSDMFSSFAIFARTSNDNFAVLFEYDTEDAVKILADMLINRIEGIKTPSGVTIIFRIALGIYFINENDLDIDFCLDKARIAQSTVKGLYTRIYRIYDENLSDRLAAEHGIEQEMNAALREGQFEVYLQPKISLKTGKVAGAEALTRWNHPLKGVISPGKFIPVFEKNGFITRLDMFVFKQVCITIRNWIDNGQQVLPVAVNMSRVHLDTSDFIMELHRLIQDYDISPDFIELEVTESAAFDNPPLFLQTVNNLKDIGFRISMDDFGTGYSCLNMLKDMPIDVLKLDKGFFANTEKSWIVVSSVIQMARRLSIEVVGEGIETEEQAAALREMGCDLGQGYVFARPMPIVDYQKLMKMHIS